MRAICRVAARVVSIALMVSAAAAGDLKPFAAGSWAGIRSERPGKALIVHFWGLTCAPCRTELPQWGELHEAFPDARLVFIHAERPPRKWEDIPEFLKKSGLETAENWYFADRFVDPLRYEIDPEWRGEMPMTILIDRDGASRTIVGSADLDEVRRWLEAEERKAGP